MRGKGEGHNSTLGPRGLRPRERLVKEGASGLKDHELLAILLRTGYRGKTVMEVAKEVMKAFPGKALFEVPYATLAGHRGVGMSRACVVQAGYELARRTLEDAGQGTLPVLSTPKEVVAQVSDIRARGKENFVALYLNTRNQLLRKEFVSIGTVNSSLVHPREIFRPAVEVSATVVILVHNHPSGDPSPSDEDIALTRRLVAAGNLMGIEVLDHVIVCEHRFLSMKEARVL